MTQNSAPLTKGYLVVPACLQNPFIRTERALFGHTEVGLDSGAQGGLPDPKCGLASITATMEALQWRVCSFSNSIFGFRC
jgi:hypothetical protein